MEFPLILSILMYDHFGLYLRFNDIQRIRPNKKNYLFLRHISSQIDEGMRLFFLINFFFFFFKAKYNT